MKRDNVLPAVMLFGAEGPWPFAGHFRGATRAGEVELSWAGRGAASRGPEEAFEVSRSLQQALSAVRPSSDRRQALGQAYAAVDALLSAGSAAEVSLLLLASDPGGASISAVGIANLYAPDARDEIHRWVRPPHPLLSEVDGSGGERGALSVERRPSCLMGAVAGEPGRGLKLAEALTRCGVR